MTPSRGVAPNEPSEDLSSRRARPTGSCYRSVHIMDDASLQTLDALYASGQWIVPLADQVCMLDRAGHDPSQKLIVFCSIDTARALHLAVGPEDRSQEGGFHGASFDLAKIPTLVKLLQLPEEYRGVLTGAGTDRVGVLLEQSLGWVFRSVAVAKIRDTVFYQVTSLMPPDDPPDVPCNAPGGSA